METKKTHWKKNNDSNYISGEDLFYELNGLKKDFPVKLISFSDGETFDQNKQSKVTKTVLQFVDLQGVKLYKGVLLNTISSLFFEKEFGSGFIDDWVGKVCNIYALPHRTHGQVVRFKKYYKPVVQVDIKGAELILNSCDSLENLVEAWKSLNGQQQKNTKVIELKNKLKIDLTNAD